MALEKFRLKSLYDKHYLGLTNEELKKEIVKTKEEITRKKVAPKEKMKEKK